jgi:hypothetical protein
MRTRSRQPTPPSQPQPLHGGVRGGSSRALGPAARGSLLHPTALRRVLALAGLLTLVGMTVISARLDPRDPDRATPRDGDGGDGGNPNPNPVPAETLLGTHVRPPPPARPPLSRRRSRSPALVAARLCT